MARQQGTGRRGWSRRTRRRWASVCGWLLRSRRWAAACRERPVFRPPPDLPVELPQHDPDPARRRELEQARRDYELVRITEKLDLPVAWNHRTVRRLPRAERYTWNILRPKLALVVALGKPLIGDHEEPETWASLEELERAYLELGFPPVRDFWRSDVEFARLRVHGPNPVWLRGGWELCPPGSPHAPRNPRCLRCVGLTERTIREAGLPVDDPEAWAEIYAVDYHSPLQEARPTEGRHLYPCIALFRQDAGRLLPLGIQFQLDADRAVWRPADGSPAWQLAKVFFGSADIFVHEIISHWMWTHVVAEKFIIHTARTLSWRHPLRRLLAPHLTSTLAMNEKATAILVGNGGTFDRTFAGAAIKAALVEFGDAQWSYRHMVHPERVRELGVERLAYHPFRDDGLLVWDAIDDYVREALAGMYKDEAELRADTEAEALWAELNTYLGGRGFPEQLDMASLHEVVTAVLFNPVHHALVNSLQFDVFGWPPMSPPTIEVPMPEDPAEVTEQTLLEALPSVAVTLDTIRSTYGFSAQYDAYGANLEAFHDGWSRGTLRRFRERLAQVVEEINRRNLDRGVPYRVCRPDLIGNSIDA